jgi:ATP-dependent Clp protease, protease subunit
MKSSARTVTKIPKPLEFKARPERTIEWLGGVNYQNLEHILGELKRLMTSNSADEIHMMVNSYGGTSSVSMSFYDAVTSWLRPNLVTIGTGDVDSSGIIVFLAGKKRYLTKNTTLLFHLAGGTFGAEKRYTVQEIESMLNEYHLKDFQYACIVSDATHGRYTPAMILELMSKNTILTAAEAVEMGLAHKVI